MNNEAGLLHPPSKAPSKVIFCVAGLLFHMIVVVFIGVCFGFIDLDSRGHDGARGTGGTRSRYVTG